LPVVQDGSVGRRQHGGETFADIVAEVTSQPSRGPRVPAGRHAAYWGDTDQHRYELVNDQLTPDDARRLAQQGALVVYDKCGCGGDQCELDWLSAAEVKRLAEGGPPVLHPSKNGRADLEHWHSPDGKDLIVVAVEVSWGDRISG
jgi:hypothetical protein